MSEEPTPDQEAQDAAALRRYLDGEIPLAPSIKERVRELEAFIEEEIDDQAP